MVLAFFFYVGSAEGQHYGLVGFYLAAGRQALRGDLAYTADFNFKVALLKQEECVAQAHATHVGHYVGSHLLHFNLGMLVADAYLAESV